MNTYELTIPIVAYAFMTVQADSAEEAIEFAFDNVREEEFEEWYPVKHIVQGNVCCHPQPHLTVKEMF